MTRILITVILILLTIRVPESVAGSFRKSYALVVGIDKYHSPGWGPLGYAVNDAKAVAAFLERQNFEVTRLYDESARRSAILDYLNTALVSKVQEDDRVIVFFAGHGGTDSEAGRTQGYIVPVDGGNGYASNIQMDELRTSALRLDKARHILFIMDACYGGLLAATRGSKVAEEHPAYVDEITRRKARQVLTAGGADQQVADGGPGGHSHFTYYLLQALEASEADLNGDGYITFAEIAAYIVPVAFSFQQTPTYSTLAGHGLGEFVFRSSKPAVPRAPQSAPTPAVARGSDRIKAEVLKFVNDFFAANNDQNVERLLAMFGSPVEQYFTWGQTDAAAIRKDKERFFKRWPDVEYTPIGEPQVADLGNRRFRVNIGFDFYVRNLKRCEGKQGESKFELQVKKKSESWEIVTISEDVYYRDKPFNPC